ncbi:hypothetical protein Glove_226g21 [Diversispora epigaea]|uniref:Uncharacterized protein n=1 Tax=Diversispora epigaea TaxID=1348612 RepID=A0A397IMB3_9GLOM|nr:hypothetical protein Glove_226g21 [Diversispora epigaea]
MKDNEVEYTEMKEKKLYSKVHVAGSIKFVVDEASNKDIKLIENDQFSCNLTTILARNREAVAINLTTHSNSCIIYISKDSDWLKKDIEYIEKIQKYLRIIYEPMTWIEKR